MDVVPDAVVELPFDPPTAIDCAPVAVPFPAAYCACTTLTPALALKTTTAIALATDDLFGLPRADEISDAATQAPRASFQMLLYDLFIIENLSQGTRDAIRTAWYLPDEIIRAQKPIPNAHKDWDERIL